MSEFEVYFEIFGKKLKTKIYAESKDLARKKIYDDIKFIKINKVDNTYSVDQAKKWTEIINIAREITEIFKQK